MRAAALAVLTTLSLLAPASAALAADAPWRHATSLIGEPKYPEGFAHYDYVNPDAPKGGTLHQAAVGTFDSLNPYIVQGVPAAGLSPFGGGNLYDTLMAQSLDQAGTTYGLVAEAVSYPDDFSWAKFRLNPKAKWHDGQPLTADDVVWSFDTLKALSPMYNKYYGHVSKAEITGDGEVTFTFDQAGNRELPNIMGDLPILPKHWWEGTDAKGNKRDISKSTLETPLGSGPYKIESVQPSRQIVWSRVPDYWAKDLPPNVGRNNFDRMVIDYYTDSNAEWQAFQKGGFEDFRNENRIGRWMTEYDFPAAKKGDVIKKEFPYHASGRMQGYFLNTRRDKFADPRVRQALGYVFDFETMNRTLFFDKYKRINSYFAGIDLASSGLPQGKELEILETVRAEVPPEVFTTEFKSPVADSPQALRDNLRKAVELFKAAGWVFQNGKLVNEKTGQPFAIEFLENDPSYERIVNPYIANLKRVGIDARLRTVDSAQYVERVNNFDYDVISSVVGQSQSPGNEQREMWSSAAADQKGSRNYAGIRNPAVDKLIDRVLYAKDREELVAATHALDRVLLWNFYVVPQWYSEELRIAYWNKFGIPEKQPDYVGVDLDSWWIDPAKEKALGATP